MVIAGVVFGAVFGSFAACQAWRLRYRIQGYDDLGERSVCMYCNKQLKWYDNIPILSWLMLGGKCRYCKHKIGAAEILADLGGPLIGVVIVVTYVMPLVSGWAEMPDFQRIVEVIEIVVMVILLTSMVTLATYDGKWGELPTRLLILSIVAGVLIFILNQEQLMFLEGGIDLMKLLSAVGGIIILPGTCYALYKFSGETLMGGGDWMLALAIALVLSDWWLALWALAAANLMGSVIMAPAAIKRKRTTIYFGPFLVMGFVMILAIRGLLMGMI